MGKRIFLTRVLQMAAGFLIFNVSGICYNIFISMKMGAEGAGLFHLIMTVYSIGVSIAVSGMSLTTTRLLSDMPLSSGVYQARDIIKKCMLVCLVTSGAAAMVLFLFSDFIALYFVGNKDCGLAIKILAPSLLCVGTSSVMSGYFNAFAKVGAYTLGQGLAEVVSWVSVLFLARLFSPKNIHMAVIISICVSNFARTISDILMFFRDSKNIVHKKSSAGLSRVLNLCAPIALGSYLRTGLSSMENFLIPKRLKASGTDNPLAVYGTVKGMAMPIVFFPAVFVNAFTSLLVPEIARRHSSGHKKALKYVSSLSVEYALRFSILICAVLFFYGKPLSKLIFNEEGVKKYIYLLCALPLFLYTDSVCDAILKGIDEQVYSMKLNAADSAIRNILIFFIIPIFGGEGYIIILYVSEIFNLILSFWRVKKKTALSVSPYRAVIVPLFCIVLSRVLTRHILSLGFYNEILIFLGLYIISSELLARPISQLVVAESDARREQI